MLAWVNFVLLVISSLLFTVYYVKSVGPAALEKRIGPSAYEKCAAYRRISSAFMFVASANYILYYWLPLPLPLPRTFPWPHWVSAAIAVLIALPSGYLMHRGMKDAGEETMKPKPEHALFGGIYTRIRHPQAVGELPLWWVFAFLVHSPFLVLFTIVYVPVWYYFCIAEERDLLIRYGATYEEYQRTTGFWIPRKQREQVKRPGT
jgi:protein-S-isoprenylcysteine O-methyltransferase Ste14